MLLSQWTLRRFIGETTAAQTCSTSEKPPFSGARSWFLLIVPLHAVLSSASATLSSTDNGGGRTASIPDATRANRIGKVDGIFVHQLLETRRLFCRVSEAEFIGNDQVATRDPVLDLPILRLTGSKSLIGLPCIGSRNLYVIDVNDTLVLVNWIDRCALLVKQ